MYLDHHGDVVVELSGMEHPSPVPAVEDHKDDLKSVVGTLTPAVRDGKLYASGTLSVANESGQRVLQLHNDGVQLQASIGAQPTGPYRQIRPGETFEANGRTLTAGPNGVRLFTSTRLREITICAQGADHETAVSIRAKQPKTPMPNETTATDPVNREELTRGLSRIDSVNDLLGGDRSAELRASFVSGTLAYAELDDMIFEDLKAKATLSGLRASRVAPPAICATAGPQAAPGEQLEAALATKCFGESEASKLYSPAAIQASRPLIGLSSVEACLRANGIEGLSSPAEKLHAAFSPKLQASGFSTISLPVALGAFANKALNRMYQDAPATWRSFCSIKSAANFHEQTGVRPSAFGELEKLGPQGEIKYDTLTDESLYTWQIDTYARKISVARQHIVNDDLGFIDEVVNSMGPAAMRQLSNLVYETLNSASSAFFSTPNGNLIASNPLSVPGLGNALQQMRSQKDERGNYIDAVPRTLVVPPELEQTAKEILQSEYTERVATADGVDEVRPTGNAHRQVVSLEVEPRLSANPTTWYLFAAPRMNPMTVGYLDGKQAPTVDFFGLDADPNTLSVQWRVYHDFGAALGDFRGVQKNTA